jgi:hypothetical protein
LDVVLLAVRGAIRGDLKLALLAIPSALDAA